MNWSNLLLQFFLCYVSTVCFGILLNIPKRAYHTAGMIRWRCVGGLLDNVLLQWDWPCV